MDCSLPVPSVHGILQARILDWVSIPFSRGECMCACCMLNHFSCARLFATLWTIALQALLSMEFSRQEYWTVLPCAPLVDLPDSGFKPTSLMSPILASGLFTIWATWEDQGWRYIPVFFLILGKALTIKSDIIWRFFIDLLYCWRKLFSASTLLGVFIMKGCFFPQILFLLIHLLRYLHDFGLWVIWSY